MRRIALLAMLATGALGAIAAPASAKVPANFFGMDATVTPAASEYHGMKQAGADVYRVGFFWREIEPRPPVGGIFHNYDFTEPDKAMRGAIMAGLDVQVTLIGSPSWVGEFKTNPWTTPEGRANWAPFVGAVLDRYGPDGTYWEERPDLPARPPIAYQVWNEQNSEVAFAPKANPTQYAKLFNAAADEIAARDPGSEMLPGGMFGTPQGPDSIYAWDFLEQFVAEPGVKERLEGVAVHPYAGMLRGLKFQMRKMRNTMNRIGLKSLPIQITELGWSSQKPSKEREILFYQGRKGQAKLTDKALKVLIKKRKQWGLERILWYAWRDISLQESFSLGCGFCQKTGLVKANGKPKPAYRKYVKRVRKAKK